MPVVIILDLIAVSPLAALLNILKVVVANVSSMASKPFTAPVVAEYDPACSLAFVWTNNASLGRFTPPPDLSKKYSAECGVAYRGASLAIQASVLALYFLTLQRDPLFGSVVFSHTEPVGRPDVPGKSDILNNGTLVCGC